MDTQAIKFICLFIPYFFCFSLIAQSGNTGTTDAEFLQGRACIIKEDGSMISVDKVQSTIINQLGKMEVDYYDVEANLIELTPLDSIAAGYCKIIQKQKYAVRKTVNTPQTIDLNEVYLSYSISNEGFAPITLIIHGQPSTLYTGATTHCEAKWDDALQRVVYCPPVEIIIPNGGQVNYFHRPKNL